MTMQPSHPAVAVSFSSPEDVQPSWRDHYWDKALLLMVALGDAISFWIALQAFNASASAWQMFVFVAAMSSAAVVTMHKAGGYARAFKARQAAHGRLLVWVLVTVWLFLGVAAFVVRLNSAEAASTSGLFGAAPAQQSPHNLIMAMLMLALFLAGGVAAYAIGFSTYNPRRTAVMRLQRRLGRVERRYRRRERRLLRRRARLATRASELEQQTARVGEQLSRDESVLAGQVAELKQIARLRMSAHLSMPSRTSGVFAHMGEK